MQKPSTASERQEELLNRIRERIRRTDEKRIRFALFMQMALYEPGLGYYQQPHEKVGKSGDFYTSAALGGIMGEVLARAFLRRMDELSYTIVEWGAGPGKMAKVILDTLKELDYEKYSHLRYELVDESADHRARQIIELAEHAERVVCFSPQEWKKNGTKRQVILWSNELLDAFPVERVRNYQGQYEQAYVGWDGLTGQWVWEWAPAEQALLDWLDDHFIHLAEGQIADLSLEALRWYEEMLDELGHSIMIHIDYGHESEELFAPHRMNGTLLCYYRHQANEEPFERIGQQDVTAHVHFSAFQARAAQKNWEIAPLVTQRTFLEREGVLELLQENLGGHPFDAIGKRNRAIRQLVWSDQMGDVFKVMEHRKRGG